MRDIRQRCSGFGAQGLQRHRLRLLDRGRRRAAPRRPGTAETGYGRAGADRRHSHRGLAGRRNRPGSHLELDDAAARYAAILELGRTLGIIPQLEIWGSSANLSHGSQALYVAAKSGHPDACVLLDAYHMYKGGTPPTVLKLLGRQAVHCFHMNDYPAEPPRETISDADRIWPGDGLAPLAEMLRYLAGNHCQVVLSLELFNRTYWQLPAEEAARTGLDKMKATVAAAGLA